MSDSRSLPSPIAFVLLTYALSWGLVVPVGLLTSSRAVQFAAVTLSAFGPLVAAAVLTWRGDGSVRDWLRGLLDPRVPRRWYLVALGIPLCGVVVQTIVYASLVGAVDLTLVPGRLGMFLGAFPVALLLTGGNEEFGWRGYLLPHLQRTRSAFGAALLVGVAWLVWHLPADILLTSLGGGAWTADRVAMRLAVIPLSVILTWLYNSSDGRLLPAMAFHAAWNSMSILVPVPLGGGAGPGTTPVGATVRIALVGFVTLVAVAIAVRGDTETLSATDGVPIAD